MFEALKKRSSSTSLKATPPGCLHKLQTIHNSAITKVRFGIVCLVTLSLSEAGPGRFGRRQSSTDIYHTTIHEDLCSLASVSVVKHRAHVREVSPDGYASSVFYTMALVNPATAYFRNEARIQKVQGEAGRSKLVRHQLLASPCVPPPSRCYSVASSLQFPLVQTSELDQVCQWPSLQRIVIVAEYAAIDERPCASNMGKTKLLSNTCFVQDVFYLYTSSRAFLNLRKLPLNSTLSSGLKKHEFKRRVISRGW